MRPQDKLSDAARRRLSGMRRRELEAFLETALCIALETTEERGKGGRGYDDAAIGGFFQLLGALTFTMLSNKKEPRTWEMVQALARSDGA